MNFLKSQANLIDLSDDRLLGEYRQTGNLTTLATLYEKYMHLVYGVCLKYLRDEELSKDAVMQVFEELIVKARRHEVKNFKSWLHVLCRNFCLMQLRSGKKMPTESLPDVMEFADDTHHYEEQEGDLNILEQCKDKLPKAQKISINLFFMAQKCYKEIVDETGYSLNEVKSYIQNGKRNLKICVEKNRER